MNTSLRRPRKQRRNEASSPVDHKGFRKRYVLKAEQITLFALLAKELSRAWRQNTRQQLTTLPEYQRFFEGAYACGFVCSDFPPEPPPGLSYESVRQRPQLLADQPLQAVRQLVHFLIRKERWNFEMADEPGGAIRGALDDGLVDALAEYLQEVTQPRAAD